MFNPPFAYLPLFNGEVSSIAGTANQIIASAGTGAVTLSLSSTVTTGSYIANETLTGSMSMGAFSYGTLSYSDAYIFESFVASNNGYVQNILQNTNAGTTASTDYIVSNNLGTATTYYGDFGINSSGFTGSGSFNLPSAVYITSTSGDLSIGTTTANAIHFVINGGTTDAAGINTSGQFITPNQIISTLATGTSPFSVLSTTQVANLNSATSGVATNITGGVAGSIPYQTSASTTTTLAIGTNGQILQTNAGATAPQWTTALSPNLTVANVSANKNSTAVSNTAYTDQYLTTGSVNFFQDDFNMAGTTTASAANVTYGDTVWGIAPITGGTTGTFSPSASTSQNPGQVLITTPAVTGDGVSIYKGGGGASGSGLGILGAETGWQIDFWIQLPATITSYAFRCGMCIAGQQVADSPTGGAWVEYDTANSSSNSVIELRTVAASTSNYVSTTITPVTSTWYHFKFTSTVSGTINVQVGSANGSLGSLISSSTDVDTTHQYMPFIQVLPRTTTAATLVVDRYSHSIPLTRV
jgi:hypothetical protein